ncbi:BRI1-KD interacting protein 130 [Zea mays]|uniref:BRI1-KD interacting protein 130 n=1 Tax=Zea mays TaxID=4577 RepID=A0A1D6LHL7_MAIZE|nr:BRI1-KD interacting protein 130 [Zea mays]AQK79365.1 BRI1-KD interacting protein 130 [Zea mays]AQK79366.1 BRI1-KD interacting protein 130 [Zea mays]
MLLLLVPAPSPPRRRALVPLRLRAPPEALVLACPIPTRPPNACPRPLPTLIYLSLPFPPPFLHLPVAALLLLPQEYSPSIVARACHFVPHADLFAVFAAVFCWIGFVWIDSKVGSTLLRVSISSAAWLYVCGVAVSLCVSASAKPVTLWTVVLWSRGSVGSDIYYQHWYSASAREALRLV